MKTFKTMSKSLSLVAFIALLVGCSGSDGSNGAAGAATNGLVSLISMNDEPMGTNCIYGGTSIASGIDVNSDGTLTPDEVENTEYICSESSMASAFEGIIYTADKNINGMYELYANVGGTEVKLVAPGRRSSYIYNVKVSPDKKRVAYTMDKKLYSVDLLRRSAPVQMHPDLVLGGEIFYFQWSPDSTKILYKSDQDIDDIIELYTVLADGSGNVKVNGNLGADGDVSGFEWAPDSSKILYSADQDTDEVKELYAVLADGSGRIKLNGALPLGGDVSWFAWAPDASKILYSADQDTDNIKELYTVSADGSNRVKVNAPLILNGDVDSYQWAPDSSKILYCADQDTDGVKELYTVRADGSGMVKVNGSLQAGGSINDYGYRWAPDSSKILYLADRDANSAHELYTVSPDGSHHTKVSGSFILGTEIRSGIWSPDSSKILYRTNYEREIGNNVSEIYTVFSDGSGHVKVNGTLAVGGSVRSYYWAPDSSKILYRADQDTDGVDELYVVSSDGSNNIKVNGRLVTGGSVYKFDHLWAPDSSKIYYRADQDTDGVYELYSVLPDGSANTKVSGLMPSFGDAGELIIVQP